MARWALAIALGSTLAAACGGGPGAPAFAVHDTSVVVETSVPFAGQPDFAPRVESTIAAALAYWGGRWSDLAGYTVTLTDEARVPCAGGEALGCAEGRSIRLTTADPGLGAFACVEQTVLVHEIGHAVVGDPLHEDPRWMQMEPISDALGGRVGYTADGEAPCTIYVSVWRHVLGAR